MKGIIDHVNLKSFCYRVLARLRIIWSASSKSASVAFKLNQRGLFISLEFSICHNISSLIIIVSIIDGLIALLLLVRRKFKGRKRFKATGRLMGNDVSCLNYKNKSWKAFSSKWAFLEKPESFLNFSQVGAGNFVRLVPLLDLKRKSFRSVQVPRVWRSNVHLQRHFWLQFD